MNNVLSNKNESSSTYTNESMIHDNIEFSWTRNTDLCVDVKTFLFKDRITQIGKEYSGVLTRDQEDHYQFIETLPHNQGKRNPRIYDGKHITATLRDNGCVRLNFKPMKIDENFVVEGYAFAVANEIVQSLKGLVEGSDRKQSH